MRDSIASYLDEMNDTTYLPGLQREFVWSPGQIAALFDSLVRDYPVGQVIRWKLRRTERDHVAYEFIRDYVDDDGAVPEEVYEAGFQRYNEPADLGRYDTLVIDGQQRLNSILIGLTGSLARYVGGRGRRRSNVENWERQVLCVDLFGHPDYDDAQLPGEYAFEFRRAEGFGKEDRFGHEERDGTRRFWYPLPSFVDENGRTGSIRSLRREVRKRVEAAPLDASEATREELRDVAVGVVNDVVDQVLEHPLPSHEVTHETEHIREIFQRINTQGSTPKPHQLLLSSLMSYWPYLDESAGPVNPRARVEAWIEQFQDAYPTYQTLVDRELFMIYSCYLLGTDLGGARSIAEFDTPAFDRLHDLWVGEDGDFGRFVGSLEKALDALTQVGLSERTMDSRSYVALLAKYFYEQDAQLDATNRRAIRQFFARVLLLRESHGTLRRSNARRLLAELESMDESVDVFPGDRLFDTLDVQPAPDDVRRAVREARYEELGDEGVTALADERILAVLALLDGADDSRDPAETVVAHVYPRERAAAFVPDDSPADAIDRLGNLQLLDRELAERKGDAAPAEWLASLDDSERAAVARLNQYPDVDPEPDAFESFVTAREERIVEHLVDTLVLDGE